MTSRRDFIKLSLGGAAYLFLPFKPLLANQTIHGKKIINILLEGGCDTANAFPPFNEPNYYTLRPTIAIKENDTDFNDLNGVLGLHPALKSLKPIWDAGDMALFPATHCGKNPNRSHFYQLDFFDKGAYTTNINLNDGSGFLARYLNYKYSSSNSIEVYDFSANRNMFNNLNIPALSIDPESLSLGVNDSISLPIVESIRNQTQITNLGQSYQQVQNALFNKIDILKAIDFSPNQDKYSDTNLSKQLRQTATLLRNIPELEIIQMTHRNFDSHSNQGGSESDGAQFKLLQVLGNALQEFYNDMGNDMQNIVIIVRTEFGRTAAENGSKGTDHGHASGWFVISKDLAQSGMVGTWPGFTNDDLAYGRYTAQTTDYRDIYAEIFKWAGLTETQAESCFPEYSYNSYNFLNNT